MPGATAVSGTITHSPRASAVTVPITTSPSRTVTSAPGVARPAITAAPSGLMFTTSNDGVVVSGGVVAGASVEPVSVVAVVSVVEAAPIAGDAVSPEATVGVVSSEVPRRSHATIATIANAATIMTAMMVRLELGAAWSIMRLSTGQHIASNTSVRLKIE